MKSPRVSRGASLIEALIALVVLSTGVLGMVRSQGALQASIALDRQRSEALRVAHHELEAWRAGMATTPAAPYRVERHVAADEHATTLSWTTVVVDWADRRHGVQRVALASASSGTPPALSGALTLPRGPGLRIHGRAPGVPLTAHDRGDGRSAFQPTGAMPIAFVFDNATGRIVARCTDAAATACTTLDALPLSGWIRVSLATPPDAARPDDTPLPLTVALQLTQGSVLAPGCLTERRDGVLAYHCAIATDGGAWSGPSEVTLAGAYRVCRYVGTSGDRNADHPERYDHVDRALMQQNFLVIRSDQRCPATTAPDYP